MIEHFETLRLTSEHSESSAGTGKQETSDFSTQLNGGTGLRLNTDCYEYYLAIKSFSSTYSWFNIWGEGYGNNKLQMKKKGEDFKDITLPDGIWTYKDIEEFLNSELGTVKDEKGEDTKGLVIKISRPVLKIVIILNDDTELKFAKEENFRHLIGFDEGTVTGTTEGSHTPNITHSIDYVYLTCPLSKEGTIAGPISHAIYGFPINDLRLGLPFTFKEQLPNWVPIEEKKLLTEIRLTLVDARGTKMRYMQGMSVFVDLMLGRKSKISFR